MTLYLRWTIYLTRQHRQLAIILFVTETKLTILFHDAHMPTATNTLTSSTSVSIRLYYVLSSQSSFPPDAFNNSSFVAIPAFFSSVHSMVLYLPLLLPVPQLFWSLAAFCSFFSIHLRCFVSFISNGSFIYKFSPSYAAVSSINFIAAIHFKSRTSRVSPCRVLCFSATTSIRCFLPRDAAAVRIWSTCTSDPFLV